MKYSPINTKPAVSFGLHDAKSICGNALSDKRST